MPHSPYYDVGRYLVRLGKHAVVEKTAGPQLVIKFEVLGVYDKTGQVVDCSGYERSFYRVLNDKTMSFAIDELKALGFSAPKFSSLDPESDDPFSFDGIECDMWCSHKPDQNGNLRENWAPAKTGSGEIEGKRADRSALRKLDSLFGKELKSSKPTASKREPQPAAAMAQGVSDDDVPF